ncbi:hypothetical protein Tco_0089075 [Tanacetum coccineum]
MLILTKVGTLSDPSPISTSAPLIQALISRTLKSNQCLRDSTDPSEMCLDVMGRHILHSMIWETDVLLESAMIHVKFCESYNISEVDDNSLTKRKVKAAS